MKLLITLFCLISLSATAQDINKGEKLPTFKDDPGVEQEATETKKSEELQ